MNPFVFSCITPHGAETIPGLAGPDPNRMGLTRKNLARLGQAMHDANPDTIIYLTPHGLRVANGFSISDSEHMQGAVEEHGARFEADAMVDRELAQAITAEAASQELPVSRLNFATAAGPLSCLPLDWGVLVPLGFMPPTPIVVITTCYDLSFEDHLAFGACIARVAEDSGKRIGLVASCDWSHAHSVDGPYGFHPSAAELDARVVELVRANDLEGLARIDTQMIDTAKPDGLWQALVLAGAVGRDERKVSFLSYEVPTYFGLLCASVV